MIVEKKQYNEAQCLESTADGSQRAALNLESQFSYTSSLSSKAEKQMEGTMELDVQEEPLNLESQYSYSSSMSPKAAKQTEGTMKLNDFMSTKDNHRLKVDCFEMEDNPNKGIPMMMQIGLYLSPGMHQTQLIRKKQLMEIVRKKRQGEKNKESSEGPTHFQEHVEEKTSAD